MRLAKAQLPPSVVMKKLNQKCRILRTTGTNNKSVEDSGGGGSGGAFIFLNVQFHDVSATNASLAGSMVGATIPAIELPANFKLATFTVLRDKAIAAAQPTSMDLWLDCGGATAAEKKLIQLDRRPRAVRVSLKFKTEEEEAKVVAGGRRRELSEQLYWVSPWYHSRIEILSLVFRPLPARYSGRRSTL